MNTACYWGLLLAALVFGFPATLKADPLSPLRIEPLHTPTGAPGWMLLTPGRPAVDVDNLTITFDVGNSKLVVLWGLRL